MQRRKVSTVIDSEKCIGCGLCVEICPARTIELKHEKAVIARDESLCCDHCAAICPTNAVTVNFIDDDALSLQTTDYKEEIIKPGKYDTVGLVNLMRSRRSCRRFESEPISKDVLEDLIRIGTTAPSGTNSQMWTFTVLPDRDSVMVLGEGLAGFYENLNKMAEKRSMRLFARLFMKNALAEYYECYYESVKEGLKEFRTQGKDRLFHGAPCAILIGSQPGASCPAEDALLATQNILLAAHSMNLGTCLIGFAVEAMKHDKSLKTKIGIPKDEPIYSIIAIGKMKEKYLRLTGRRKVIPRYFRK